MVVTNTENLSFKQLKNIASIQSGYNSRGQVSRIFESEFKLLKTEDLKDLSNIKSYVDFILKKNNEKYLVKKGDILFQSKGVNNFAFLISQNLSKTVVSSSFYIIRLDIDNIKKEFITWWLNSSYIQSKLKLLAKGSYIPFISKEVLGNILIPIIPIKIQNSIVNLNNNWEKEKSLIDKYLKTKSTLIENILIEILKKHGEKNV